MKRPTMEVGTATGSRWRDSVSALGWTAIVAATLALSASNVLAQTVSGSNSADVKIPDKDGFVASTITISGAPDGAVVKGVDVSFKAVHPASGDLNIDLNADAESELGNYNLWERDGGSTADPGKRVTGIDVFDGIPVNRTWYLYARDEEKGNEGYIDEWSITVHYGGGTAGAASGKVPSIDSVSPEPVVGADHPQPFTIKGSNFVCQPNVVLRDLKWNLKFPDRAINSCSDSSITISPNFQTAEAAWSVEVINPGGKSSGPYKFMVKAPPPDAKPAAPPRIDAVSPDPVTGADRPQEFTIEGSGFVCNPDVALHDMVRDFTFPKRPIVSCTDTRIVIKPNFMTGAAKWTVEVVNPDGQSSGVRSFTVKAPE